MRYKSLEEVAGKYGLTVDLDERAQLSEWESRLKKLLETKKKDLPNAKNPSLRHKVERECAEVQDASKFVCQQNIFSKLQRCVDEDKQEIFEHELKKPDSRSNLPLESDAEYEQYLEIKAAARKRWPSLSFEGTTASPNHAPSSFVKSATEDMRTASTPEGVNTTPSVPVSNAAVAPAPRATLSSNEPGRSATGASVPLSAEPPKAPAVPVIAATEAALATLAAANSTHRQTGTAAASGSAAEQLDKKVVEEKTLPVTVETRGGLTSAVAARVSAETSAEQKAAIVSQTATVSPPNAQDGKTETTSSKLEDGKKGPKIPIKREHVSAALDILVKLRALTGLGGSFTTFKIIGTALAVFLIAVAGLVTELTRERSRQNQKTDESVKPLAHEESRVIPGETPSREPNNQNSEVARQSSEPRKQLSEVAKQNTETPKENSDLGKLTVEPTKTTTEPANTSSDAPEGSSKTAKPPETSTPPVVPVVVAQQELSPASVETKAAPLPKPIIQLALLRIESTPPDATITIRGTKQPLKTPAEFNLAPGDYDVALAMDCYSPVSTTLHLDGGDNRLLTRELQSLQPALTIRTVPAGAKIYVDGKLRNQLTPATVTGLEAGDRWVTVELAGYRSQNMAVKAKCGETVPVEFGALQRPTARVSITSNARGASVWIDGSDSGQLTPCSVELPLGSHRVRLVGPHGYRPEEKSVFLQDEDSVRLDVPLTPELVAIPANNVTPSRPNPPAEYTPPANPNLLIWCGLDYSMVKMIGTARDFPEGEIFPNSVDRRGNAAEPMTRAWNDLFMKEMYPRLSRELGITVQADLQAIEQRNARVGPRQIVDEDSSPTNGGDNGGIFNANRILRFGKGDKNLPTHISEGDIAAAIRSYRLQTRSGLGLVFIMDRLVKKQETGCMYVVFFDIGTRTIISEERVCTNAGGGGIRNHWFGAIKETVKRLPEMYRDARLRR